MWKLREYMARFGDLSNCIVMKAKATDQTNKTRTEQKRKREKEKNNGVRLENKFKKEVEKGSKPQGGAKKEMSDSPNAVEARVSRDKKAEMKKNKKVGATNEKEARNTNNSGQSIYQDMTHFREELAKARREVKFEICDILVVEHINPYGEWSYFCTW